MDYTVKISFSVNRSLTDSEKYLLLSGLRGSILNSDEYQEDEMAKDLIVSNVVENISKGRTAGLGGIH